MKYIGMYLLYVEMNQSVIDNNGEVLRFIWSSVRWEENIIIEPISTFICVSEMTVCLSMK